MGVGQAGEISVLKRYFGYTTAQTTLRQFADEVAKLSAAEKHELAVLAAKEMRMSQEQVSFLLE